MLRRAADRAVLSRAHARLGGLIAPRPQPCARGHDALALEAQRGGHGTRASAGRHVDGVGDGPSHERREVGAAVGVEERDRIGCGVRSIVARDFRGHEVPRDGRRLM